MTELFDHEAELALIGAALVDPRVTSRVGHVPPEAFHDPVNGLVWRAMNDLGDCNFDVLAVRARLVEIGGGKVEAERLRAAEEQTLSAANAQLYAETVLERAQRRRLVDAAEAIGKAARSWSLQGPEVVAEAEAAFMAALSSTAAGTKPRPLAGGLAKYMASLRSAEKREGMVGLATGIPGIDRVTKGLRPGQVIVVAARPGCGKSVLADQIGAHVARHSGRVLAFNLEMEDAQIAGRQFLRHIRQTEDEALASIRSRAGADRFMATAQEVSALAIDVEDRADLTIGELRAIARRHKLEHPDLALVTIDYLGLVKSGLKRAESREREVAHVSRQVKVLAKELGVPVILLAQLNREAEKAGREPRMSDLRESGGVEADADVILFIHHDGEVFEEAGVRAMGEGVPAFLIIAKNRRAATGRVPVWFRMAWSLFQERAPGEGDRPPPSHQEPRAKSGSFKDRYGGRR